MQSLVKLAQFFSSFFARFWLSGGSEGVGRRGTVCVSVFWPKKGGETHDLHGWPDWEHWACGFYNIKAKHSQVWIPESPEVLLDLGLETWPEGSWWPPDSSSQLSRRWSPHRCFSFHSVDPWYERTESSLLTRQDGDQQHLLCLCYTILGRGMLSPHQKLLYLLGPVNTYLLLEDKTVS